MKTSALVSVLIAGLSCFAAACSSDEKQAFDAPDASAPRGPEPTLGPPPFFAAGAIGVSDLDRSFDFYTRVVGMALRYERTIPGLVKQKVLYFPNGKASDVVLMSYIDGQQHNFTKNPVKLVFYAPSATALIEGIRGEGLQILAEPVAQPAFGNVVVGFARDPDGYVIEVIEEAAASVPYLGALGIGVSDLDRSIDFYTRTLHLVPQGAVIQVPNVWDEIILTYPNAKSSAVVLLHYTDGSTRNYTNNPIKLALGVSDTLAAVAEIEREGHGVIAQPSAADLNGKQASVALVRDPDGYTLELIGAP
jgi:catechol 2,3-dioxygenase-like lactoylglutathione lyase family enzyme